LQVDPPSVTVRFCDVTAFAQAYRRAQMGLDDDLILDNARVPYQ